MNTQKTYNMEISIKTIITGVLLLIWIIALVFNKILEYKNNNSIKRLARKGRTKQLDRENEPNTNEKIE